jgi:hypothetical protein
MQINICISRVQKIAWDLNTSCSYEKGFNHILFAILKKSSNNVKTSHKKECPEWICNWHMSKEQKHNGSQLKNNLPAQNWKLEISRTQAAAIPLPSSTYVYSGCWFHINQRTGLEPVPKKQKGLVFVMHTNTRPSRAIPLIFISICGKIMKYVEA